jgi:hypothetical protein
MSITFLVEVGFFYLDWDVLKWTRVLGCAQL